MTDFLSRRVFEIVLTTWSICRQSTIDWQTERYSCELIITCFGEIRTHDSVLLIRCFSQLSHRANYGFAEWKVKMDSRLIIRFLLWLLLRLLLRFLSRSLENLPRSPLRVHPPEIFTGIHARFCYGFFQISYPRRFQKIVLRFLPRFL